MTEVPFEVRRLILVEGIGKLKAWVFYRKISQVNLANELGISQPAVSIMLNRKINRKSTLLKMSKILNVPYELLAD